MCFGQRDWLAVDTQWQAPLSYLMLSWLAPLVYRREIGLLWIHNGKHHSVKFVARKGVEQERGEGYMGSIEIDGVQAPRLMVSTA